MRVFTRLEDRLVLTFLLTALALLVLLALSALAYLDLSRAQHAHTHTLQVLNEVNELEALFDGDRGLAYCALTGQTTFLSRRESRPRVEVLLDTLRVRLAKDPAQLARLNRMADDLTLWQATVVSPLTGACPERADEEPVLLQPAVIAAIGRAGEPLRRHVFTLIEALRRHELGLLRERTQRAATVGRRLEAVAAVTTAVFGALALFALWHLRRSARQLRVRGDQLSQANREQQLASDALTLSQRRTEALMRSVQDGIIAVDAQGLIEWFNPAAEAMLRCAEEAALGQPVTTVLPVLKEALPAVGLAPAAGGGESGGRASTVPARQTIETQRMDGETFPLELSATELWVHGQPLLMLLLRDLSEQARVDGLKRDFVSLISHELRTPLTSIRGALSLLASGKAGELSAPAARMVTIARTNGDRLLRLVGDILDEQGLLTGQMRVDTEILDAGPLAEQCIEAMDGYAQMHHVQLKLAEEPTEPAWVDADALRLHQVLSNLISNAIKHAPPQSTVELKVRTTDGTVQIDVVDQGPGLPEEFRARVFKPFAQADTGDTRVQGSSGLGLSICKGLVELMDGHIGFDSPPGGPTTFWVRLPATHEPVTRTDFGGTGLDDLIV